MYRPLEKQAIKAALAKQWKKAISLNLKILEEGQQDENALNRLAHAYLQIGEIKKAKQFCQKVISINRFNSIAQKKIDKIDSLSKTRLKRTKKDPVTPLSPSLFIEELGKTKSVNLTHIAPVSTLASLNIGDPVILYPKKHSIEVRDQQKSYIGALPDDVAFRLLRFLKGNNQYQTFIKRAEKNSIAIFIREAKRGKRFRYQPSFSLLSREKKEGR